MRFDMRLTTAVVVLTVAVSAGWAQAPAGRRPSATGGEPGQASGAGAAE